MQCLSEVGSLRGAIIHRATTQQIVIMPVKMKRVLDRPPNPMYRVRLTALVPKHFMKCKMCPKKAFTTSRFCSKSCASKFSAGYIRHDKDTSQVGAVTEAKVTAALLAAGYSVLVPWGGGKRYDLVVDIADQLFKVQCKTGRYVNGAIIATTISNSARGQTGYHGHVDYFGIYCFDLDQVYLIPLSDVTAEKSLSLRAVPTKNKQIKNVLLAEDYRIKPE